MYEAQVVGHLTGFTVVPAHQVGQLVLAAAPTVLANAQVSVTLTIDNFVSSPKGKWPTNLGTRCAFPLFLRSCVLNYSVPQAI